MGNGNGRSVSRDALFIFLIAGLGGILVDLDHLIWGTRAWHTEALILGGVLVGCGLACFRGLSDK
jgi:hypothetical protein